MPSDFQTFCSPFPIGVLSLPYFGVIFNAVGGEKTPSFLESLRKIGNKGSFRKNREPAAIPQALCLTKEKFARLRVPANGMILL